MEWAVKQLGGTQGLGLDINPQKVELAVAAGRRAVVFDINAIPGRKLVRFTLMSHFLEHVADMVEVRRFIRKACQVSTEFVLIKQPYFDADGYLMRCGLKTYWSDWTGHPNTMSSLALYHILRDLKRRGEIGHYSIHARYPISSSADPAIHPLGSPVNQHDYDPARHPPKRMDIKFQFPVYRETAAWITMKGVDHRALARRVTMHETLYDEA